MGLASTSARTGSRDIWRFVPKCLLQDGLSLREPIANLRKSVDEWQACKDIGR